ncbi:hypothetical protein ACOI1H_20280 [Loktanella sp. DJP18]|uniref:hypothetical protein n=1 Tax=Loktanella sp. DJP18 TaxID=3409788 RepID=UPI003BB4E61D
MGQYHKLICPTAGTCVQPDTLNSGGKAIEQVFSAPVPAVLAFLCADGLTQHPRDLPWAPTGLWAGHAPLMIGDYREDEDLIGRDDVLTASETELYLNAGVKNAPLKRGRRSKNPKCIAAALKPLLERVLGIRYTNMDIAGQSSTDYGHTIRVKPSDEHPTGWDEDISGLTAQMQQSTADFHARIPSISNQSWRRAPAHMPEAANAPDTVPSVAEADGGSALIWVNLDRMELINPADLGDTPDLTGIMIGDSSKVVQAMLFHHEARGSGDLHHTGPFYIGGRWRGDRIVLMGPGGHGVKGKARLSQSDATSTFTDITGYARIFLDDMDIFGTHDFEKVDDLTDVLSPSNTETAIMGAVLSTPRIAEKIRLEGRESFDDMLLIVVPPIRITYNSMGFQLDEPIVLAGTADAYTDLGGRIWLPAATRAQMAGILKTMPEITLDIRQVSPREAPADRFKISWSPMRQMSFKGLSNHAVLAAFGS